jgi:hypothetical protein
LRTTAEEQVEDGLSTACEKYQHDAGKRKKLRWRVEIALQEDVVSKRFPELLQPVGSETGGKKNKSLSRTISLQRKMF